MYFHGDLARDKLSIISVRIANRKSELGPPCSQIGNDISALLRQYNVGKKIKVRGWK